MCVLLNRIEISFRFVYIFVGYVCLLEEKN